MALRFRPATAGLPALALGTLLALTGLWCAGSALADEGFPTKPVTLVVGFPAGGGTDIMARQLSRYLERQWQTPVLVENRTGAGGIVAAEYVSRAEPNGHVLMMAHIQTVVLAPLSLPDGDRAAISRFEPVSLVARQPHVVAVRADASFQSLDDLLAAAASGNGALSYGSTGPGGVQHLAAAAFAAEAGVEMLHVPYQGSAPALQGLIAGEIDVFFDGITPATPFLSSGEIRPLAVTTRERIPSLDAPPLSEAGFPGYEMTSWWAVVGPKGLTEERRDFIAEAVQQALQEPEFVEYLGSLGVMSGSGVVGEHFADFVESEVEKYGAIAASLGISP